MEVTAFKTRQEILDFYSEKHIMISNLYYVEQTLDKDQFDRLHQENWVEMENKLKSFDQLQLEQSNINNQNQEPTALDDDYYQKISQ